MGRLGSIDGNTPDVHSEAWIAPGAILVGRVTIDRGASVWYGSVLRADDDDIIVGAECNIQDQCCLHVDAGEPVVLGERVSLGHGAMVHGALVGDGALIGIGATVLGRARIGAGTLVAAGTVIRPGQQVPAGVLVAGVPGRIVRELTSPPIPDNPAGDHLTSHSDHCEPQMPFTAPGGSLPLASWNRYGGSG
jgi:carbonic anhydrase/acetyltransferase-like protein (isoleucine patch superfamily)